MSCRYALLGAHGELGVTHRVTAARRSRAECARGLHPLDAPSQDTPANLPDLLDGLVSPLLRPAAVLVALVERGAGPQVLFTLRNPDLTHHAGQVSFPGGRLEEGETIIEGALREAAEEIGLDAASVELLGFLDPLATISGYRVTPVVAWMSAAATLRADPSEVAEIFEVSLVHLRDPLSRAERVIQWLGRERRIGAYKHPVHDIWGVTASILDQLIALPETALQRKGT
ncbi:MAG: CoA pyrophosphatase [Lysobacterales bacterium]